MSFDSEDREAPGFFRGLGAVLALQELCTFHAMGDRVMVPSEAVTGKVRGILADGRVIVNGTDVPPDARFMTVVGAMGNGTLGMHGGGQLYATCARVTGWDGKEAIDGDELVRRACAHVDGVVPQAMFDAAEEYAGALGKERLQS